MRKSKWYVEGYQRGLNIGSWIDLPEIGKTYFTDSDGRITVENENDAETVFMSQASESESNSRDYSPFEFTASAINKSRDPDKNWEDFDSGIFDGVEASWAKRAKEYYKENPKRRAKRNPEIHVDINSHNQREAEGYMKNPGAKKQVFKTNPSKNYVHHYCVQCKPQSRKQWRDLASFPYTPEGKKHAIQYARAYKRLHPNYDLSVR